LFLVVNGYVELSIDTTQVIENTLPQGLNRLRENNKMCERKQQNHTSGAEARADFAGFIPGINPRPTAHTSFPAACQARPDLLGLCTG
jgi:hypothetical protein